MSKPLCPHGIKREKNLRCDHGYIQVLVRRLGKTYCCENFGPHTKESQAVASIRLSEVRKEILQGKIGIAPELPSKRFADVAGIWFEIWKKERNPDGKEKHNKESCYKVRWTLDKVLIPAFGKILFHELKSVQIYKWRRTYTDKGLSGVTANRYQAVLSSIYAHVGRWVKTEQIKPAFKLPEENPCEAVEMAPTTNRERILSKYEAGKLKNAFMQLNDPDGWEICKLALKSVLSLKDLKGLEIGQDIDILRSKTGVPINLPLPVLTKLNWYGWRTRWDAARVVAGFAVWGKKGNLRSARCAKNTTLEFRDLRKTGINWLKGRHDLKLVSEYAGHASIKTTEGSYTIKQAEKMQPLVQDLAAQVDSIK